MRHQTIAALTLTLLTLAACDDAKEKDPDGGAGTSAGDGATGGVGGVGGSGATGGTSGTGGDGGTGATSGSGGAGGSGGTSGTGGSGGCTSPADCDDNINCTADDCDTDRCTNVIDLSLCSAAQVCDLRTNGCKASTACGANPDCVDTDACTRNERCDLSAAACKWDMLDNDSDGHAPETCGGDDPDDADGNTYPGAPEVCDGKDNDGDGVIDTGVPCGGFCTSDQDRAAFANDMVEQALTSCINIGSGTSACVASGLPGPLSDACTTCVDMWINCRARCNCGSLAECRLCECRTACPAAVERCTGLPYPVACN